MNIKKIVLWLTVITIASFLVAFFITFSTMGGRLWPFSSGMGMYSKTIDHSISYDAKDYTAVNIHTTSVDVTVIPIEGDEIEFHFYGEASVRREEYLPKLIVEPSGQRLTAKIEHPVSINIGFDFSQNRLDVGIPKAYIEEIVVSTASGSIDVSALKTGNIQAESHSGKLRIADIQTDKARFKTTSGEIQVKNFTGVLQASSISGKIHIQLDALLGDVNLKNTSGKIEFYLPEDAGFKMQTRSVSGKTLNNFLANMNNSLGSRRMEAEVGNGAYQIEMETVSGNMVINR